MTSYNDCLNVYRTVHHQSSRHSVTVHLTWREVRRQPFQNTCVNQSTSVKRIGSPLCVSPVNTTHYLGFSTQLNLTLGQNKDLIRKKQIKLVLHTSKSQYNFNVPVSHSAAPMIQSALGTTTLIM